MSLAGNLEGKWEFHIAWDSPQHPTSDFKVDLFSSGAITVLDDTKSESKGVWIQGTQTENPRVSLSFIWGDENWIFEGNGNDLTPTQIAGTSVGVLVGETYYRGSWVAERY